jgi:hypothetical protein
MACKAAGELTQTATRQYSSAAVPVAMSWRSYRYHTAR